MRDIKYITGKLFSCTETDKCLHPILLPSHRWIILLMFQSTENGKVGGRRSEQSSREPEFTSLFTISFSPGLEALGWKLTICSVGKSICFLFSLQEDVTKAENTGYCPGKWGICLFCLVEGLFVVFLWFHRKIVTYRLFSEIYVINRQSCFY